MMGAPYFKNVFGIGDLFVVYVYLDFETEPILFVGSDEKHGLYLCLCSEIRHNQKWIISKCNYEILRQLCEKEIDIATAICTPQELTIVEIDTDGTESSYVIDTASIDELDLPERGVYLNR